MSGLAAHSPAGGGKACTRRVGAALWVGKDRTVERFEQFFNFLGKALSERAGVVAALCCCGGLVISAIGVITHQLKLVILDGDRNAIMVAATTGRSGDRVAIGRIAERAGGPRRQSIPHQAPHH